ncbi:MAG TPA: hypothetical protein VGY32_10985 [Solirubrobacteraceae bacterium]|jgi:hypothetical protein|nr:hypothetical protein [Solirubrobacteraceae bacterium]
MLENPAGLVYGTLIVGALLDAESTVSENYPDTVGAVAITLVLFWLAHSYAEFAGNRLKHREALRLAGLGHALVHGLPTLAGGGVPWLVLVLCWVSGATLDTAVGIGIWSSAGMILVIELAAGVRAELSGVALLVQSLVGAALGALILALKVVLH